MSLLPLVVLVPALLSGVGLLLSRRTPWAAVGTGVAAALVTLVLTLVVLVNGAGPSPVHLLPALDAGEVQVPLQLSGSVPAAVIAMVVALVTLAVQAYASWYLADDDRRGEFASTVSVFAAAMLLVVLSDDLVLTLVGWEVMGWCSYLLIGHWSRREAPRRAAHKAFLVTRFADVGFVLGVVVLAAGAGSTSIAEVLRADGGHLSLGLVLLVIGVLGKSAQFPFQDWLPDAMEGPTPASALIHAATMVAAGTFVLARLAPLLAVAPAARWTLAVSTAVTMLLAAVLALGQSDLKRMLAWSTVSQVAVMLSALAAAPPDEAAGAAVLHLYGHAFFKALLFLVIGWLGLLAGGTAAARLRGSARGSGLAKVSFLFGLLALAGLPFVVGGVSKEHVVAAALAGAREGRGESLLVLVALLLTVVLTAAYATRAWLVVTGTSPAAVTRLAHRVERSGPAAGGPTPSAGPDLSTAGEEGQHEARPPSVEALLAIGVLLAGTVLGGIVVVTDALPVHGEVSVLLLLGLLLLVVGGAAVGFLARGRDAGVPALDGGLGFDRLYLLAVATPVLALARAVARVDDGAVDATARGAARAATWLGGSTDERHRTEAPATGIAWVLGAAVVLATVGVVAWR